VKKIGRKKIYINFLIELEELNGRALFNHDVDIDTILEV